MLVLFSRCWYLEKRKTLLYHSLFDCCNDNNNIHVLSHMARVSWCVKLTLHIYVLREKPLPCTFQYPHVTSSPAVHRYCRSGYWRLLWCLWYLTLLEETYSVCLLSFLSMYIARILYSSSSRFYHSLFFFRYIQLHAKLYKWVVFQYCVVFQQQRPWHRSFPISQWSTGLTLVHSSVARKV